MEEKKSGIFSDNFWTRALAIFGHNLAITACIWGALFALAFFFAFVAEIAD